MNISIIEKKAKFIMGENANERSISNMIKHIEGKSKIIYKFGIDVDTIEKYESVMS